MPAARDWEDTIRAVVSHALSQKWRRCLPRGGVELIAALREHKLISGEIKPSTWHRV